MSGGGGSQGTVRYAEYLEQYHEQFLRGGNPSPFGANNFTNALIAAWASDPYAGASGVYNDPSITIAANLSRWGDLNTLVNGMTVEGAGGDWRKYLTEAVAQIDVAGVLKSVDVDPLATSARGGAANVATGIDGLISLTPIDVGAEAASSRSGANLAKNAVVGTYLDWGTAIDGVVTKVATASPDINVAGTISSFFTDITMADLFTLVEGRLATMIGTIVTNSFAAVNPTLLQNLADAFVAQRANERARTRTRYKAGAIARGGEASSAYALGLALLDGDFSTETSTFQTQSTLQLYQQGIETYNSLLQGYLGNTVQVELANRGEKTRFAGAAVTANKQLKDQFLTENTAQQLANNIQRNQTDMQVYVEAFRTELTTRVQAKLGDKQADTQTTIAKINGYVEAFKAELMARVSLKSEEKKIRDGMIDKNISAMLQHRQFIVSTHEEVTALRAEISRINYVMDSEYTGNTLDRNVGANTYKLKTIGMGVPVFGALGGGTAIPDKHSKAGSVLGGVLSGAVTGGKAGGPWGALAGGILGGVAGGFG